MPLIIGTTVMIGKLLQRPGMKRKKTRSMLRPVSAEDFRSWRRFKKTVKMGSGIFNNGWEVIREDESAIDRKIRLENLSEAKRIYHRRKAKEWDAAHPEETRNRKKRWSQNHKQYSDYSKEREKQLRYAKRKNMEKKLADKRKKIMCIYGVSGSGKTLASLHLKKKYGAQVICSYTTRPMRPKEVDGVDHFFVSEVPDKDTMLAYTQYGGYEYWALKSDVQGDITVYVIDEAGINMLDKLQDEFRIYPVRTERSETKRLKAGVSEERIARDRNRQKLNRSVFAVVENVGTKAQFYRKIESVYERILKL